MTSTPTRPVDNVVIATKSLQDRNLHIFDGTTVENKGKLILNVVINLTNFKYYKQPQINTLNLHYETYNYAHLPK